MSNTKIEAGAIFPRLPVSNGDDQLIDIGKPQGDAEWQIVVVYRGRHCPLCTNYLNRLPEYTERLGALGVGIAAVSADSKEQMESHLAKLDVDFPLHYGLTLEQMQELGLYVSIPRSAQETDHLFPEPGLFVINGDRQVQVVDISNNPFVRPELEALVSGLEWIKNPENDYPIRGTYRYMLAESRRRAPGRSCD